MAKYLIGMHNAFDEIKYTRDYRKDFFGIEFCNLDSQQINRILQLKKEKGFEIGIHFPLNRMSYPKRDPLIFSKNQGESELAFEVLEKEIAYAKEINASYLLFHFPKPMIIDSNLNWEKARFQDYEYIDEAEYSYEIFRQKCFELFGWLNEKRQKYDVDIILEIEIINKYLYRGELLKQLLDKYSEIKLCLDTARLHVLNSIDEEFDIKTFLLDYAPYTELLHISNIQVQEKIMNGHYPALEGLKVQEGWGDIKNMLELISSKNKYLKILFEHRSDLISDTELQQCYDWISKYFDEA